MCILLSSALCTCIAAQLLPKGTTHSFKFCFATSPRSYRLMWSPAGPRTQVPTLHTPIQVRKPSFIDGMGSDIQRKKLLKLGREVSDLLGQKMARSHRWKLNGSSITTGRKWMTLGMMLLIRLDRRLNCQRRDGKSTEKCVADFEERNVLGTAALLPHHRTVVVIVPG